MKKFLIFAAAMLMAVGFACSNKKEDIVQNFPEVPPDRVVEKFYGLISEGGKLTTKEALTMVSTKYRELSLGDFRRWTESYSPETKFTVKETIMPTAPDKDGDWIAVTKLEVKTPSSFSDYFITTSQINLILDQADNKWKIDFLADSIYEEDYKNAPAEARAEEGAETK